MDIKKWTDENKKPGQRFKDMKARKQFVKDKGLKVVTNPKTGQLCVPVLDKTVMLSGSRHSTKRSKEQSFDDHKAAKEAFAKQKEGVNVQTNSKAGEGQAVVESLLRLC